ncbi:MAG TPA: N-acetylmuramoyl-L-alanine amidase [Candidatus Xenobia bacterium]|jgi:N-acetylmuramoyl-L-alanine amidase
MDRIRGTSLPLAGKRIVVDPGHGGQYNGAVGVTGTLEKNVNLDVATHLADDLRHLGATVRMTRTGDTAVAPPGASLDDDLKARIGIANQWKADLFVSVHSNSELGHNRHGIETYHRRADDAQSKRLACDIMQVMSQQLPVEVRGVKPADFWVIKHAAMPATLVEVSYLSNPGDEQHLKDPAFRQQAAGTIATGIEHWFQGVNAPPLGDPTDDPPQQSPSDP